MLSPVAAAADTATVQLRGRQRPAAGYGLNRVKDGFTLGALRVAGGPPATPASAAGAAAGSERTAGFLATANRADPVTATGRRGRRSTTLFDRTRSGQGILSRLRGQVRSVSPLTSALGGSVAAPSAATVTAAAVSPTRREPLTGAADTAVEAAAPAAAEESTPTAAAASPALAAADEEHRLSISLARQSSLRLRSRQADNASRFLLAQANPRRTQLGFGLQPGPEEGLFGGGLSLFGGGISLFG